MSFETTKLRLNKWNEGYQKFGLFFQIRIPLKLTSDAWLSSIEQMLVFLLIVGRWLMPNRKISHDELSLLLFVYLGMGSDIMELLDLFEEDYVLQDDTVLYVILVVWSASLFQFTIVLTATKSGHLAILKNGDHGEDEYENSGSQRCTCCKTELWSICTTIFLQDGPFLAVRLYVIIKNKTLTYTILFFTLKNVLMLLVQMYRLFVVGCCHTDQTQGVRSTPRPRLRKEKPAKLKAPKEKPAKTKTKKKKEKQTEDNNVPTVIPQSISGLQDFTPEPIGANTANPRVSAFPENRPTLIPNGSPPMVTTQYHPSQTIPMHTAANETPTTGPPYTGNQNANLSYNTSPPAVINPPPMATQTVNPSPQRYSYQNMNLTSGPSETMNPSAQQYGYQNRSSVPNGLAQTRPNLRYSTPLPTSSGRQQYGNQYVGNLLNVNNQMNSGLHSYSFPSQAKAINTLSNVNPPLTGYQSYGYQY